MKNFFGLRPPDLFGTPLYSRSGVGVDKIPSLSSRLLLRISPVSINEGFGNNRSSNGTVLDLHGVQYDYCP